jgi:hypothetical protein
MARINKVEKNAEYFVMYDIAKDCIGTGFLSICLKQFGLECRQSVLKE